MSQAIARSISVLPISIETNRYRNLLPLFSDVSCSISDLPFGFGYSDRRGPTVLWECLRNTSYRLKERTLSSATVPAHNISRKA